MLYTISHIRIFGFSHGWITCIASPLVPRPRSFLTIADTNVKRVWRSRRTAISQVTFSRAKSKTSVNFDDLPQGAISLDAPPLEKDRPAYPTVVLQARANMQKFENCVLLTRVGGFYELYFEHAEEYGPKLNLKVAQKKTSAGNVSMAGFPFFQLDRFLKILVRDLNRYVAIAEEFSNDDAAKVKAGGLLHDRRVSRIITPGTLIDETFMDPFANNYILAIHVDVNSVPGPFPGHQNTDLVAVDASRLSSMLVGLAWLDLSSGNFLTQSIPFSQLPSALARIAPSEVVLEDSIRGFVDRSLFPILNEDRFLLTYCPPHDINPIMDWSAMLEARMSTSYATEFTSEEVTAGSIILSYVKNRLQGLSMKLQLPLRYHAMEILTIDKNSMSALEIRETMRDRGFKGSLLHAIRRTVTKSGTRLLSEWIGSPSTSIYVINSRLDCVACMLGNATLRENLQTLLRKSHDSQRLAQKFSLGRGDSEDLIALANTILVTEDLLRTLQNAQIHTNSQPASDLGCLTSLIERIQLEGPKALAIQIKKAIDEEGILQQHHIDDDEAGGMIALANEIVVSEGSTADVAAVATGQRKRKPISIKEHYGNDNDVWIMKPDASPTLERLHGELTGLIIEKSILSVDLQARLKVPSLTLRWTPSLGHICHVKGKDTRQLADTRSVSSSKSTKSFHNTEWTRLGQKIDLVKFRIRAEEHQVFLRLREQVILNLLKLRRSAAVLDELDIFCSFATLAEEQSFVRPLLNTSSAHKIIGGRHPTVREGLQEQGRSFVANDCFVGERQNIWLITGPNMGGKSTFLRQNALITILAQVGCYVPAHYAEIGIVDQIFSRIGSADNLYRDQSTFMVEMLEAATILKNATSRSFVIMDEVGRGTTPKDGVAVAFACLHHLYHVNKCRTLFATHFHTLADLSSDMLGIGYFCTDVVEGEKGYFNYKRRLREGVNRESHALKVAKLAGLPESVIGVARETLKNLTS